MKKVISLLCAGVLALGVFTGCTGSKDKGEAYESGKLQEVLTAVKEDMGEAYFPNVSHEAPEIESLFGVKADSYEEAFAEVPMININIDTFIGVEAKDGKVEEVKEALEAYKDKAINDDFQYPSNLIKLKGSKVYTRGNYVFYICLAQIPDDLMESPDEEAQIKAVEEGNDKVIEVINSVIK